MRISVHLFKSSLALLCFAFPIGRVEATEISCLEKVAGSVSAKDLASTLKQIAAKTPVSGNHSFYHEFFQHIFFNLKRIDHLVSYKYPDPTQIAARKSISKFRNLVEPEIYSLNNRLSEDFGYDILRFGQSRYGAAGRAYVKMSQENIVRFAGLKNQVLNGVKSFGGDVQISNVIFDAVLFYKMIYLFRDWYPRTLEYAVVDLIEFNYRTSKLGEWDYVSAYYDLVNAYGNTRNIVDPFSYAFSTQLSGKHWTVKKLPSDGDSEFGAFHALLADHVGKSRSELSDLLTNAFLESTVSKESPIRNLPEFKNLQNYVNAVTEFIKNRVVAVQKNSFSVRLDGHAKPIEVNAQNFSSLITEDVLNKIMVKLRS